MRVEFEISEKNECTQSPYWLIIDPVQMMKPDIHYVASMITGPFFSREEAQDKLDRARYNYSDRARVYCASGYATGQYADKVKF